MARYMIKTWLVVFLLLATPAFAIEGPDIGVTMTKYDPYPAEPGKYVTVWFKVENDGGSTADNVLMEVVPEYPFFLQANEKPDRQIGMVGGHEFEIVKYKMLVDENAISGDNDLKVRYRACDFCMWVTEDLNLEVAKATNAPDLELILSDAEPEPYQGGTSDMSVDIVNAAPGTAYYVLVDISSEIATIRPEKIYVGNMEPDDIDTLDFTSQFGYIDPGNYPLNFNIKYKDSNFDDFEKNETIIIHLKDRRQVSTGEENPLYTYLAYALAIIAVIWFYKKRKKLKIGRVFDDIMTA